VRPWISDVVDLDAGAFSQVRTHNLTHEIEVVRQMSFKPQLQLILGREPAGCCYSSVTQCPAKAYRRVRKRAGHRLIVAKFCSQFVTATGNNAGDAGLLLIAFFIDQRGGRGSLWVDQCVPRTVQFG